MKSDLKTGWDGTYVCPLWTSISHQNGRPFFGNHNRQRTLTIEKVLGGGNGNSKSNGYSLSVKDTTLNYIGLALKSEGKKILSGIHTESPSSIEVVATKMDGSNNKVMELSIVQRTINEGTESSPAYVSHQIYKRV